MDNNKRLWNNLKHNCYIKQLYKNLRLCARTSGVGLGFVFPGSAHASSLGFFGGKGQKTLGLSFEKEEEAR